MLKVAKKTIELMKKYNEILSRINNAIAFFDGNPDAVIADENRNIKIHNLWNELNQKLETLRIQIQNQLGRQITASECLDGFKI